MLCLILLLHPRKSYAHAPLRHELLVTCLLHTSAGIYGLSFRNRVVPVGVLPLIAMLRVDNKQFSGFRHRVER